MRFVFSFLAAIVLSSTLSSGQVTLTIDGSKPAKPVSRFLTGACLEDVNHEVYGGIWSQLIFGESFQEPAPAAAGNIAVSGMWRPFQHGDISARATIEYTSTFAGSQSQGLSFISGLGEFGIENSGLNHQGIPVLAKKTYDGFVWIRSDAPADVTVDLASSDGLHTYAAATLAVGNVQWHRYEFSLSPGTSDPACRFEIKLKSPASIVIGYVFLQPGEWGRFAGLPLRRDVVEGLQNAGITALRYGGSMVNNADYRWKKMIGPPDRRPPYHGLWYPQSSNGFGIIDFLNLCEAAKMLPVPAFNMDEKPADMADFIEYANGDAGSFWGHRRVTGGHPAPYGLTHIELGNEERVDAHYYERFAAIAGAIWAVDPKIILVVGDFQYENPIADPLQITGADSRIKTLAAHRQILELAKKFDAEVWFDVHVWTEAPPASKSLAALPSYIDAIDSLANGAKHHVVVFELNANNHSQKRALANAQAIIRIERDGRLPFVSSANCLQVDRQNINGWDQGLLFLNPTQTWLQPPGYVEQMISQHYQPKLVDCTVSDAALEAAATTSDDRREIVLQVVNASDKAVSVKINFEGLGAMGSMFHTETLAAGLNESNPADDPQRIKPVNADVPFDAAKSDVIFQPNSFTVCMWKR